MMKAPIMKALSTSKDLSVTAFITLLRSRPMFVLQELGIYLMFLGINSMQIFASLFSGNFVGLMGGLAGFGIIGSLLSIKVRRLHESAQAVFNKIGLKREDKNDNENMAKDLEVFEFLFNKRYNKTLKLKIDDKNA